MDAEQAPWLQKGGNRLTETLFVAFGMSVNGWLLLGFIAQAVFSARFIVQWIASEKKKESTIPKVFWYLSILGSGLLLTYTIHKNDPVFILGQSVGSIIYIRNLMLFKDDKNESAK